MKEGLDTVTNVSPQLADKVVEPAEPSISSLRAARIDDYQRQALTHGDALKACLGGANGAMLRMGHKLEQFLEEAFETLGRSARPEDLARILPALDTHLKVMRQVDRLANLDLAGAGRKEAGIETKKSAFDTTGGASTPG
jgi:hypothetical protein